ncbi:MAG: AhpC/TSA family protein [Rikenellaceae bacterium]|nr:AhpC/TSA family protein [Rikenellaceae bacterium]
MKKLALLFFPILFFSCADKYVIDGTIPNYRFRNSYIYMLDFFDDSKIIDSAFVKENEFRFKGEADPDRPVIIQAGKLRSIVILEKGKTSVDMSGLVKTKGTSLNNILSEFHANYTQLHDSFKQNMPDDREVDFISIDKSTHNILQNNNNNIVGVLILTLYDKRLMKESNFLKIYESSGEFIKENETIKRLYEFYSRERGIYKGKKFVDFTIPDGNIDGTEASLSDYVGKGKYTLVTFWASWETTFFRYTSDLKKFYSKHHSENLDIVGVSVKNLREHSLGAIQKHNIPWPNIFNAGELPIELYEIKDIPLFILFDPEGIIIHKSNGFNIKDFEKFLN